MPLLIFNLSVSLRDREWHNAATSRTFVRVGKCVLNQVKEGSHHKSISKVHCKKIPSII
jgi:hypothetical protein